jgi:hypothetical protein
MPVEILTWTWTSIASIPTKAKVLIDETTVMAILVNKGD